MHEKRNIMSLPMLKRCCGFLPLDKGCILLTVLCILACVLNIASGVRLLTYHKKRKPEDNLISMSMVIFSTLSAISNVMVLQGMRSKRPGYLQFSILFNSLFIVFIFLVAIVTCLFSPEYETFLKSGANIAPVVIALVFSAAFCLYYLVVLNSMYRRMKLDFSDSAVPV